MEAFAGMDEIYTLVTYFAEKTYIMKRMIIFACR